MSLQSDTVIGVFATLTIATLSGFAAVYTERVLKRRAVGIVKQLGDTYTRCEPRLVTRAVARGVQADRAAAQAR